MQVNRAQGMEQNENFLAEAAWNPQLTPEQFFKDYIRSIFGKVALPQLLSAYEMLEQNEEYLGWRGEGSVPCCVPLPEIRIIEQYAEQEDSYE